MEHLEEHIKNAQDWQLNQAMIELEEIRFTTKNTVVKNIVSSYINTCSLELHNRK